MAQPNIPAASPVTAVKVLDLSSYCHGASKYLGSSEVNVASGGFICVTRRVDIWTQPTVYVLDLVNLKRPHFVASIALDPADPTSDRRAQCKVSPGGQWAVIHDSRRVWLQDLSPDSPSIEPRCVKVSGADIQLVTWVEHTVAAVVTDGGVSFITPGNAVLPDMVAPIPYRQTVAYWTAGPWTVSSAVRFEKSRAVGSLSWVHKTDSGPRSSGNGLSGFAGAFTSSLNATSHEAEQTFIYADVGGDAQSLTISSIALSHSLALAEVEKNQKWTVNFRHPRSHDLTTPDIPIAVHVSPEDGLVFVLTSLSYAHVFQLADGNYSGSVRISTPKISASTLCKGKMGLIVVDASGTVFRVALDVNSWLARLSLSSSSNVEKLQALRLVLKNDIAFSKPLFFELFPNFVTSNGQAYYDAVELLEPLSGEELYKFFGLVLKKNPSLLAVIRMLAKRFSERMSLDDLTDLFKLHGGSSGVLPFLNAVGPSNLSGKELAVYVETSIEMEHYAPLEKFLLQGNVREPEVVQRILKPLTKSDPDMTALFEKFCSRYDLVEGLVHAYLGKGFSQLASVKKLIEKADPNRTLRIFKALFDNHVPDALLEAFLHVVKTATFTPDLVNLFKENNKLQNCAKYLESLVAQSTSDISFFHRLLTIYNEDLGRRELNKAALFKRLGSARCTELGHTVEETDYALALSIYRNGECDWSYIMLAYKYGQNIGDITSYILARASTVLWADVLLKTSIEPQAFNLGLFSNAFQAKVSRAPFAAVRALATALVEGSHHELAVHILKFLSGSASPFNDKAERGFFQNCYLVTRVEMQPDNLQDSPEITAFIADHDDFSHVNVLIDLLHRKILVPARVIVARLADETVTEEVMEEDIHALERAADSSGEKSVWMLLGHIHLKRDDGLKNAMEAYTKGQHHGNYAVVLKAMKNAEQFDDWNTAADYMKMVKRHVKDPKGLNTQLSFALAKTNRMDEFEKLLTEASGGDAPASEQVCPICEDAPLGISFRPCGHVCTCVDCADKMSNCPICRQVITAKQRVFLS